MIFCMSVGILQLFLSGTGSRFYYDNVSVLL